ncbi:LytTR family DNA-binding domain-containing protein [Wenyingzhuangia sp. 2_MG-2023]|uniref:LytR/AlgR family response regulator transcription factor n=1 Tax=Wenyingzhuangia sp. 2_MG-2023 TaxID=3062639 RepID=UPI0026E248D8|nr:LytTR family DNA-binding domain-containing protein [Wenyingzhuangia sp. 2_MG-2023]MDO6738306.1 LytTR family DNA-binding domain-containing protein [Wenyingzhuangia sp. 2_MG-2023]
MRVVIIEDEKPSARRLERMLNLLTIEVEVKLHSVAESVEWLSQHPHPDLLMLDIQLSDGLSFEIFEHIKLSSAIIFTTAYDEYALRAFKQNSIDYLLKPIDSDELEAAIEKFKMVQPTKIDLPLDVNQLRQMLVNPLENNYKTRFTSKVGQHLKLIATDEIECVYSENKGTYLYTEQKRSYLIDESLEALEEKLDPKDFFRVNRTFYVHVNAIKNMVSYTNSRLQIVLNNYDQNEIIVSREKVKSFKNWIE